MFPLITTGFSVIANKLTPTHPLRWDPLLVLEDTVAMLCLISIARLLSVKSAASMRDVATSVQYRACH